MDNENYLQLENLDLLNTLKITKDFSNLKDLVAPSNKEFQNDKIASNVQRTMLSTLLAALPIAIEHYKTKPGQSSAYSLTNIISQINDLFQEIRSSSNLENQVEYINTEIILPLLKGILAEMFDITYYIKQQIKGNNLIIDKPEIQELIFNNFDSQLKKVASSIEKKGIEAEEKLKHYLLEV